MLKECKSLRSLIYIMFFEEMNKLLTTFRQLNDFSIIFVKNLFPFFIINCYFKFYIYEKKYIDIRK